MEKIPENICGNQFTNILVSDHSCASNSQGKQKKI